MSKLCLVCNPAPNKMIPVKDVHDPVCPGCGRKIVVKITGPTEFYGAGIVDMPILDRLKYRGRGRPRKTDYMTFVEAQRRINTYMMMACGVPYHVRSGFGS